MTNKILKTLTTCPLCLQDNGHTIEKYKTTQGNITCCPECWKRWDRLSDIISLSAFKKHVMKHAENKEKYAKQYSLLKENIKTIVLRILHATRKKAKELQKFSAEFSIIVDFGQGYSYSLYDSFGLPVIRAATIYEKNPACLYVMFCDQKVEDIFIERVLDRLYDDMVLRLRHILV